MRAATGFLAGAAALAAGVSAAAAGLSPIQPRTGALELAATLSSAQAGARPVALTLTLQTALECGQAGPARIAVQLPKAAPLPRTLPPAAVVVGGRTPADVRVSGHRIAIDPGRPPGVTCHSITVGGLVIRFTLKAQLGNPRSPGSYTIAVRRGTAVYRTRVAIR